MRSLEWGYTEGWLTEAEVIELSRTNLKGADTEDLLEELIEAKLVIEILAGAGGAKIRSRFAEAMRLLGALRQLFGGRPWQTAPRLVADFRLDRRRRKFPRRDLSPDAVLESSGTSIKKSPLRQEVWRGLTKREGFKLSAFQERAIERLVDAPGDCGTIVTAGTGSGKTMAFYLPAIVGISELISAQAYVKALAIYPRVELLKDQFDECFRMMRSIDGVLAAHGRRTMRIGALFGSTPRKASRRDLEEKNWRPVGSGFVCPWLRCPTCQSDLIWHEADYEVGQERLVCSAPGCTGTVSEDQVVLTRFRMQKLPPDVLFTTTELLNQRLSDHWTRALFGIGLPVSKRPKFVLLDEVHTYQGAAGAQAGLTLRRWRHLLASPIHWVGLSATLGDAARFFADLTGADADRVVEITPAPGEMEEKGTEYQILLRGDPTSRASLLSTTIQTSMLLPRLLDVPGQPVSGGVFGERAFLFTDDLDAVNRLYDDLKDAEAYDLFGRIDPNRLPLANLRGPGVDAALKDLEGQRWRICEDIGHPLSRRLILGRTTSQDGGVTHGANVVVATASLEVGFNDPHVGAVIQHKAPRGMASFLQRKGRAGRDRAMHPLTVTVLSDYGRDRTFFQGYERLFEPALEPQHLPIRNPYVLKMQSVYALLDWIGERSKGTDKAWVWDLLGAPQASTTAENSGALKKMKEVVHQLFQGEPSTLQSLKDHLIGALRVDESEVETLLWEAPRSLLLEVVPTLFRRLFPNWKLAFPTVSADADLYVKYHPLPDFVPRMLFGELNLPEVQVIIPPATIRHEERIENMPALQALTQLAPGRVTRRFAFERGSLSHWVAVDPSIPVQSIRVSDYAIEHEYVGAFRGTCNETNGEWFQVYRPRTVRVQITARTDALPSSNSTLCWQSDIEAQGAPLKVPVPPRTQWRKLANEVGFFLHRFRSSVTVRRFAPTVRANIRTLQNDFQVAISFVDNQARPSALGFEMEVDGFYVDVNLPQFHADDVTDSMLAASKIAFVNACFVDDDELPDEVNVFQKGFLFQILLSAIVEIATVQGLSLEAAVATLPGAQLPVQLKRVMAEIFGAGVRAYFVDDEVDDDSDQDSSAPVRPASQTGGGQSRLERGLSDLIDDPAVQAALRRAAQNLASPDASAHRSWLRTATLSTLAEAILQACVDAAPRNAAVDTLLVDVQRPEGTGAARVWITESTIGGAGVLEAFAEAFSAEPHIFFSALEAAVSPTDMERVDLSLRRVLELALTDGYVADKMAQLRSTQSHAERSIIWEQLATHLVGDSAVDVSHAVAVSLNARLLRPGAGPKLDDLLRVLLRRWDEIESEFGLSLELRVFAHVASKDLTVAEQVSLFLSAVLPAAAISQVAIHSAIELLLWPREAQVRQAALSAYSPYRTAVWTDAALIREIVLSDVMPMIQLMSTEWEAAVQAAFEASGRCRLWAEASQSGELRSAIVRLVARPVSLGFLQFFPVVEKIERIGGQLVASFVLREQV